MSYTRQLAAIMFTDIAGYTAMMQHHETDALNKLHRFKEVLHSLVPAHQGEIIQYYGDGCLIIFKNAVDAVSCGKVLQETFALDPQVPARIGIHLGEVVFEDGNIFSDSVNIASRIESMGVPGAVLVSDTIQKQIKNKPEFQLTSLGPFEFKNVDEPLEVFALSNPGFPVPGKHELHGKFKERAPNKVLLKKKLLLGSLGLLFLLSLIAGYFIYKSSTLPEHQKSIAVLAFTDMSPDKSQEYLGDGLADDIITALSKIKDLKVIGRTSSFQFKGKSTDLREIGEKLDVVAVLEGSVQKSGNTLRVTAQLIDTKDGTHIWSQKWDREMTDIFSIQDEIASGISEKLKVTFLSKPGKADIKVNPEAYVLFLQARELYHSSGPVNIRKAKEFLLKSKAIDSTFSSTYAYLANAYRQLLIHFPPSEKEKQLMMDSVLYYAQKALSLNPEDPAAYIAMANWHTSKGNWIEVDKMARKAVELNPGASEKNRLAIFLNNMGYHDEAFALSQEALLLEPLSPEIKSSYLNMLMQSRRFDETIHTAKKYLESDSTNISYWTTLAFAYIGKKQYKAALNAWTRQHESYGNKTLADIYRTSDFKAAMMAWLEMAKTNKVISPHELGKAVAYAMLEDKENTLKHLELALANNETLASIKTHWLFNFVRSEPRFKELYRKLNFDAYDEYRKT